MTPRTLANLTGGSRKGIPNKLTVSAKGALAAAFDRVGGVDALVRLAESDEPSDRRAFWSLWGKAHIATQVDLTATVTLEDALLAARERREARERALQGATF